MQELLGVEEFDLTLLPLASLLVYSKKGITVIFLKCRLLAVLVLLGV